MTRRPTRRALLAAVAALAGCAGDSGDSTTTTESPRDTSTTRSGGTRTAGSRRTETPTTSPTTDESTPSPTPTPEPVTVREWPDAYYQGPLVSAHEHMNGPDGFEMSHETMDWFVRWMTRNRVDQVMAITSKRFVPVVEEHDDRLVPFYFPWGEVRHERDRLSEVLAQRLDDYPLYEGLGEFSLYSAPGPDGDPPVPANHPEMLKVYDLAADRDVPVMVHGGQRNHYDDPKQPVADMEAALEHNRDCTFLVHGTFLGVTVDGESDVSVGEAVATLFDRHPNFYYDISGQSSPYAYRYNEGPDSERKTVNPKETKSREWFESKLEDDGGVESHATRLHERFEPILTEYSDRVTWGMDASWQWHYNGWAMDTWVDIARALLGRLPEEQARNVGYRTAVDLFDIDVETDS